MAIIFQDGFDHYGDDQIETNNAAISRAVTLGWGQISTTSCVIANPGNNGNGAFAPDASRTGRGAMMIQPTSASPIGARLVLPSTYTTLNVHYALYVEQLPDGTGFTRILEGKDSGNTTSLFQVNLLPTGALEIKNEAGSTLFTTGALAITPGNWHYLQFRIVKHASSGAVRLLINDVEFVNLTGQNTGDTAIAQLQWRSSGNSAGPGRYWIDDLVVNDDSGSYNTGLLGTLRVATLYPRADDEQGWTANRRRKFGNGVGKVTASGAAFSCADNVQFEFGTGDFTMEGFFRFLGTPTGSNSAALFSKWREDTNQRSYRLFLGGPSNNNGHLEFRCSTDGQAGTDTSIFSAEFTPVRDHYYHIAVQRASGQLCVFVDGVPLGAPVACAQDFFNGDGLFTIGSRQGSSVTMQANTNFNGLMDEIRITKGVARYNMSGFTPPSDAFPRSVVAGDADFNSVSLLIGFDSAVTDESSFARAITSNGTAARYAPDDGAPGDYKTVNNLDPLDDTGIEAPYIAAQNILTFTGQPANADTVEVDSVTYTFNTVLGGAGSVLIGATVNDTIDNLVAAINGDAGEGTLYGTGTTNSSLASATNIDNSQMKVVANTPGTAGNAITADESCANASWYDTGGTFYGGLDIPGPSSFLLTRLPPQTTGIKALALVGRMHKTDSGPAKVQMSFVTADDSSANGAEHAITTSDAFYSDIIEQDPSTSSALAPASFIGSRVRVDRTE